MKLLQRYSWIKWLLVYGTVVFCTAVLISLCFNEGLDYDESFSFSIVHDNKLGGIAEGILASPYNDVIPLWYIALKIWTCILGVCLSDKYSMVKGYGCVHIPIDGCIVHSVEKTIREKGIRIYSFVSVFFSVKLPYVGNYVVGLGAFYCGKTYNAYCGVNLAGNCDYVAAGEQGSICIGVALCDSNVRCKLSRQLQDRI